MWSTRSRPLTCPTPFDASLSVCFRSFFSSSTMLPSPSSSPQAPPQVLEPITNVPQPPLLHKTSLKFFPTPPNEKKPKRQATLTGFGPNKRVKLTPTSAEAESDYDSSSEEEDLEISDDEDVFMAGPSIPPAHYLARRQYVNTSPYPSTLPVLQSFVSSHKSDVFKCVSVQPDRYLTPPYACSYSHGEPDSLVAWT